MKELEMIIKAEKLEVVKKILDELGCGGMTVSNVMGCGMQRGYSEEGMSVIKGMKTNINLLPKMRVVAVVADDKAEPVLESIEEAVSSGNIGDGKIFIRNVEEVIRIRTGERGDKAL